MKVNSLSIVNVGLIENETIIFDKSLLLFYGAVKQGKTTILNAVRWVFGGPFPADIIRHGSDEACIEIRFENGSLKREFYRAESGEIKSRPLSLIIDGIKQARPVDKLKHLLNPFLLDQDYLVRMSELERKKYFAEVFNISTPELDAEAAKANTEAANLRAKVAGYGDIVPIEVKRVNAEQIRSQLSEVRFQNQQAVDTHGLRCAGVLVANRTRLENEAAVSDYLTDIARLHSQILNLQTELATAKLEHEAGLIWLKEHPVQTEPPAPTPADVTALENALSEAGATNVRAEQYERDSARLKQKQADEKAVLGLERRQRVIRDEKIAKLDAIADASGIPGLKFRDDGSFAYEDTMPGMLSTSQLMRLSQALSEKYPDGIGLDLIDRGESLGKSIFEFIDRAKAENKTILATIVGEKPATVPEGVGVFVVEDGKLK